MFFTNERFNTDANRMTQGRYMLLILLILSGSLNILFYISYSVSRYQDAYLESRQKSAIISAEINVNTSDRISLPRKLHQSDYNLKHLYDSENVNIINPHSFEYVINPYNMCKDNVEMIITVCSSPENFHVREVIRKTWGSYVKDSRFSVKLIFVLGVTKHEITQRLLEKESVEFKDILQEDFVDSYKNLSLKSVAALKWISTYCGNAKYGLKVDDDMYINIPNLLNSLRKISFPKYIMGSRITGAQPQRNPNSKWYTPKESYSENFYPGYVSGTAYSFTVSAAVDLYIASKSVKLFWLEDVYITGLCAQFARITRLNNYGFSFHRRKPDGCAFKRVISGHHVAPSEMLNIQKKLNDPNLICD